MAPPVAQNKDSVVEVDACSEEIGRRKRPSVNELASKFTEACPAGSDLQGSSKRDRSESGDQAPAGKRGALERDPDSGGSPAHFNRRWKEYLDSALEDLQERILSSISRDIHEFNEGVLSKLNAMDDRLRDLERHVEEKDCLIDDLTAELRVTKDEVRRLSDRAESAEMNSRIPCLVLSGRALAPQRSRLGAPLPLTGRPAPQGVDGRSTAGSADPSADSSADTSGRGGAGGGGRTTGGRDEAEVENVRSLVIGAVKARLRGIDFREEDIDRAHRLPGPNNRIIVRFVRSGQDSIRDQLMTRRLELRHHNDLFINESLTAQKGLIYRSLLDAKKAKKIYTVFTRWGHVYFKAERYGTSTRVDGVGKLRELGFQVRE